MAAFGHIVIHPIGKPSIAVEFPIDGTILDIKRSIENQTGIPVEKQRLFNGGTELPTDGRIRDYSMTNATTIRLILKTDEQPKQEETNVEERQEDSHFVRKAFVPLPVAAFPRFPLPGGAEFASQNIFLYCLANQHVPHALDCDGRAYPQELQPGGVRLRCASCLGEMLEFARRDISWDEIFDFDQPSTGFCFICDSDCRVEFLYRCNGLLPEKSDGKEVCKAESVDLQTAPLPGVLENKLPTPKVSLDTKKPDPIQITFHPCGHAINANGLPGYLKDKSRKALLQNHIASAHFGSFVLKCFEPDCNGILPRTSCKLAGKETYERLKEWGTQEQILLEGGVLCIECLCAFHAPKTQWKHTCPNCQTQFCEIHQELYEVCHQEHSQIPDSRIKERITQAFEQGRIQSCPNNCPPVEKENDSTHMTCSNCNVNWCYFCGQIRPNEYCENGCPAHLIRYHLTRAPFAKFSLFKFHRLKTLRLLRNLRNESEAASPGQFDRVFQTLSDAERSVSQDQNSAELTLGLPQILLPPPKGDFISSTVEQTVLSQQDLIQWP